MASAESTISLTGTRSTRFRGAMVRWLSASKLRIDSSVSPKKSSRTGALQPRRKEVEDAAAHGVFAGLAHGGRAQRSRCPRASGRGRPCGPGCRGRRRRSPSRRRLATARAASTALTVVSTTAGLSVGTGGARASPSAARRRWDAARRGRRAGSPRPETTEARSPGAKKASARSISARRWPSRATKTVRPFTVRARSPSALPT